MLPSVQKLMCGPQIHKIGIRGTIKFYLGGSKLFTDHFSNSICYLMFNNPVPQILYVTRMNVNENS